MRLARLAGWLILLDLALIALGMGLRWRDAMFPETAPIRFRGDITNGLNQGERVVRLAQAAAREAGRPDDPPGLRDMLTGWVQRYDELVDTLGEEGRFELDYTPARLAVMSLWARHILYEYPDARGYQDAYTQPLLHFNTACELLSAIGLFLLVRHWLRRAQVPPPPGAWRRWRWPWRRPRRPLDPLPVLTLRPVIHNPWRANLGALMAATLMWFNPVVVVNAHGWPQWDIWALPFYVWAIYLASAGGWISAGVVIGLGAMFKGQILFAAPILLIWPIVLGRLDAAFRCAIGALLGGALVIWPWLIRTDEAYRFLAGLLLAGAILTPWFFPRARRLPWWSFALAAVAASVLVAWPWLNRPFFAAAWRPVLFLAVLLPAPWVLRRRALPAWFVTLLTLGILLAALRFPSSTSWYNVGFEFPQRHHRALVMGPASNLAAILDVQYRWTWRDDLTLPAGMLWLWPSQPVTLPLRDLMKWIYFFTLLLCGIGAALQARRNDPRFLIAVVAPWLLSFALLPQMHERYLIWGAALTAACAALGLGMTLLHLLVTFLAFIMMFPSMLAYGAGNGVVLDWRGMLDLMTWHLIPAGPPTGTNVRDLIAQTRPGIGWMVILIALIYLYLALAPSRRPRSTRPAFHARPAPLPPPSDDHTSAPHP